MEKPKAKQTLEKRKREESNRVCHWFRGGVYARESKEVRYWNLEDFRKLANAVAEKTFPYEERFVDFETAKDAPGTAIGNVDEAESFARVDEENRVVYLYVPVSKSWLKRKKLCEEAYKTFLPPPTSFGIGDYHSHALGAICEFLETYEEEFEKVTIAEDEHATGLVGSHREELVENYSDWTNRYEKIYVEFTVDYDKVNKEVKVVYIITSVEY